MICSGDGVDGSVLREGPCGDAFLEPSLGWTAFTIEERDGHGSRPQPILSQPEGIAQDTSTPVCIPPLAGANRAPSKHQITSPTCKGMGERDSGGLLWREKREFLQAETSDLSCCS